MRQHKKRSCLFEVVEKYNDFLSFLLALVETDEKGQFHKFGSSTCQGT